MYQRLDDNRRMTDVEAAVHYPDSYIIMRRDGMYSDMGTLLYVGDNMGELMSLVVEEGQPYCGIVEGLNYRRSLGGVVING